MTVVRTTRAWIWRDSRLERVSHGVDQTFTRNILFIWKGDAFASQDLNIIATALFRIEIVHLNKDLGQGVFGQFSRRFPTASGIHPFGLGPHDIVLRTGGSGELLAISAQIDKPLQSR